MPDPDSPQRCCPWYTTFGRLKPGVTIERARAELTAIAQRVSSRHPEGAAVAEVRVVPLRETLVGDHALTLFGLFGAVGCILLIGSANVANLLLSRGVSRRREVLTRLALGATQVAAGAPVADGEPDARRGRRVARAVAVSLGTGRHRDGAGRAGHADRRDAARHDRARVLGGRLGHRQRGLRPDPAHRLARRRLERPRPDRKPHQPPDQARPRRGRTGRRGHRGRDRGAARPHGRQSPRGGRRLRHGTDAGRRHGSHHLDAPATRRRGAVRRGRDSADRGPARRPRRCRDHGRAARERAGRARRLPATEIRRGQAPHRRRSSRPP